MSTWKLAVNLTKPFDPEWEILVQRTLGDKIHPDRKTGFILARIALLECLKQYSTTIQPHDLDLISFSEIKGLPHFTISLSHTKDVGAALVSEHAKIRTSGIDIEHEKRIVKEYIMKLISHPGDVRLRNIELWSLKEAVFKTLMNTKIFTKNIEFKSIEIKDHTWTHSPSGLEGKWEQDLVNEVVVSRAFLEN